jgi:hypothetical protein
MHVVVPRVSDMSLPPLLGKKKNALALQDKRSARGAMRFAKDCGH